LRVLNELGLYKLNSLSLADAAALDKTFLHARSKPAELAAEVEAYVRTLALEVREIFHVRNVLGIIPGVGRVAYRVVILVAHLRCHLRLMLLEAVGVGLVYDMVLGRQVEILGLVVLDVVYQILVDGVDKIL